MSNDNENQSGLKKGAIKKLIRELLWVYGFFKSYIPRILAYIGIVLAHTYLSFIITYKIGSAVDFALGKETSKVIQTGIFYVVVILINAVVSIISNRFSAWNYNDMQRTMVKKVFRKILNADWEELNVFHSGDLITRLSSDVKTISGNANGFLTTLLSQSLVVIVSLGMIVYYDVTMLLVVVVIVPIIFFSSKIFINKMYEFQGKIREVESRETSYYKETFHNIQAVKAFGLSKLFSEKISALEDQRYSADMRSNWFSLLSWAVTYLGEIFSGMICVAWAFYRVSTNVMTFGTLSVVVVLALRIAIAGKSILELIPISLQITVATERVRAILNLPDEQVDGSEAFESFKEKAVKEGISVQIKDMSFGYKNGRQVFDGVGLEAHPGEVIALVGPSGEGKTTMLRILLGILQADRGEVAAYIKGKPDEKILFSPETRSLFSYVPQGNTMLAGTIEENMRMLAPDASKEEIVEALEQACAYDFVKKLPGEIEYAIGEGGVGFSEGQNQRLAIARALLRKTPILLLDEATSALDVVTERKVLRNLMQEHPDRVCILTTHRPSVLSMCNRVYRIDGGQIRSIDADEITKLMNEF